MTETTAPASPFAVREDERARAAAVARPRAQRQHRSTGRYPVTVGGYVVGHVERFSVATSKTAVWWTATDDNGVRVASGLPTRADAVDVLGRTDDAVRAYRDAARSGAFGDAEAARQRAEDAAAMAAADEAAEPEPFEMCVGCGERPWGHGYCGELCKQCAAKA